MKPIRIMLVDDHNLVRAGIRVLVQSIEGAQIIAEAENGREALTLALAHNPDLVIMDISMKELNGIEATANIVAQVPSARVLILSMHAAEEFVRRAMKAGASGYLVKDSAPMELEMAIRAVMNDEIYLSSRVARHVVSSLTEGSAATGETSLDALTARQREVLQMVAEGNSTKEIAAALQVSVKTVETHRAAIMERLRIRDVAGLVMYAARNNLILLERPEE
jgi:DNA-binding NarL/FixJ family response regulator